VGAKSAVTSLRQLELRRDGNINEPYIGDENLEASCSAIQG
jgi:hypothetical protein